MTMVPPHQQNLSIQHYCNNFSGGGYVGGSYSEGLCVMRRLEGYDYSDLALASASPMAAENDEQDKNNKDESWLQLSIGGTTHNNNNNGDDDRNRETGDGDHRKEELVELNLLPSSSSSYSKQESLLAAPRPLTTASSFPHHGYSTSLLLCNTTSSSFPRQEMNYMYRPMPSSSSFMARPAGPYFARPFQLQGGISMPSSDMDFRVINPPRRPHSGIWFMLQASQNQSKEPFLPQIPRSYLRIKDGRMTILLVMKYIANKLSLESESEVEMTCRGQQLLPFLTLQHVRDNIWSTTLRDSAASSVTLLTDSSSIDHLMVLHYARTA